MAENSGERAKYIRQGPTGDYTVEGKDQKSGSDPEYAHQLPGLATLFFLSQGLHAVDGTLTTTPTYHGFSHQDRQAYEGDTNQIDEYKRASAIFSGLIRKPPDITQSDGRTGSRQDEDPS